MGEASALKRWSLPLRDARDEQAAVAAELSAGGPAVVAVGGDGEADATVLASLNRRGLPAEGHLGGCKACFAGLILPKINISSLQLKFDVWRRKGNRRKEGVIIQYNTVSNSII